MFLEISDWIHFWVSFRLSTCFAKCVCLPCLSVRTETLAATVAPPAGGAGIMWGKPTNAAEVTGRQGRGRGHGWQVVGLWPLGQVLPIREHRDGERWSLEQISTQYTVRRCSHLLLQQRCEVLPEALLEVVSPRLPLFLLWTGGHSLIWTPQRPRHHLHMQAGRARGTWLLGLTEGRQAGSRSRRRERGERVVLEVVLL